MREQRTVSVRYNCIRLSRSRRLIHRRLAVIITFNDMIDDAAGYAHYLARFITIITPLIANIDKVLICVLALSMSLLHLAIPFSHHMLYSKQYQSQYLTTVAVQHKGHTTSRERVVRDCSFPRINMASLSQNYACNCLEMELELKCYLLDRQLHNIGEIIRKCEIIMPGDSHKGTNLPLS